MRQEFRYRGSSGIINGLHDARLNFATNTLREATFFDGAVAQPLLLREALAALYQVVVSDYKYRPRDRFAFFAWLAGQDRLFLANLGLKDKQTRAQLEKLELRLAGLDEARTQRLQPFHAARRAFFEHIHQNEYELAYLLDPVITVHPDEISFEAFSRDESSYARLAAKHELFSAVDDWECGTTNIDFSARLHGELQRMRDYRSTRFTLAPSGFAVSHDSGAYKEKKIDLPDSWLFGFLQVHSVMSLSLTRLTLAPVDLFNICRFLRRHRAKTSPRALRFELQPGQAVRAVLEPWGHVIDLSAQFHGDKAQTVRTWGRDRLQVLARLLPRARRIDLYLAGQGMPSVYVLDLGPVTFTLGLSGWTDNDWTGGDKFSLLSRRLDVSAEQLTQVYEALRERRFATADEVASATGLGLEQSRSALASLCQVGRAMIDLGADAGDNIYRHRDLLLEPFSAKQAAASIAKAGEAANPLALLARAIFESDNVRVIARRPVATGYKLSASAKSSDAKRVRPLLHVDHDGQIIEAGCTCSFIKKHQLTQGPCEHILALRLAHMQRLQEEDTAHGPAA